MCKRPFLESQRHRRFSNIGGAGRKKKVYELAAFRWRGEARWNEGAWEIVTGTGGPAGGQQDMSVSLGVRCIACSASLHPASLASSTRQNPTGPSEGEPSAWMRAASEDLSGWPNSRKQSCVSTLDPLGTKPSQPPQKCLFSSSL